MNKTRRLVLASLIAALLMSVAACSEPTDEPEPALADLSGPADLDSYRSSAVITWTSPPEGGFKEWWEENIESVRDPLAYHSVMTMGFTFPTELTGGPAGTFEISTEIYQVDGMGYRATGGAMGEGAETTGRQWSSVPMTDTSGTAWLGGVSSDVLRGVCAWQYQGKEKLDGVVVHHWSLPKAGAEECFKWVKIGPTRGLSFFAAGDLTAAGGDLYVPVGGDYLARVDLFFEGTQIAIPSPQGVDYFDRARGELGYTLSDANEPITIEVPEEAFKAAAPP